MGNYLVSVVMPVRNAASTLAECIDSIRSQTLDKFEVIIIDDGSEDASFDVLEQWRNNDRRVKIIRQARLGIVTALNRGLHEASSPLVARMDADDIMHPQRLEQQVKYLLQHPHYDLLASQVRLFPANELKAGYQEYIRWQNLCISEQDIRDEIYIESPFAHPSVILKKATVLAMGGYRDGDFPEDYDLWLRMAQAGCRMVKLPQYLLSWRESESRATRIDSRYSRDAFDRLRSHYLSKDVRINNKRPIAYWGAGRKTRRRSALMIEKGFLPSAWIDIDNKKIGNRIDGAWVQAPAWLDANTSKPFVLSYITNHGARDLISDQLHGYGYRRGIDYLHVG